MFKITSKFGLLVSNNSRSNNILDKWIISRLEQITKLVTDSLDNFDVQGASGEVEKFVDDLSTWYIRRSRGRVGIAAKSEEDVCMILEMIKLSLLC